MQSWNFSIWQSSTYGIEMHACANLPCPCRWKWTIFVTAEDVDFVPAVFGSPSEVNMALACIRIGRDFFNHSYSISTRSHVSLLRLAEVDWFRRTVEGSVVSDDHRWRKRLLVLEVVNAHVLIRGVDDNANANTLPLRRTNAAVMRWILIFLCHLWNIGWY